MTESVETTNVPKVNLLIGITACNRLLYSKALLRSLQIFKDDYSDTINTRVIYVDNGTTEPGAREFLDSCETIDEVVYRPERDPSNDEWKGKNEILSRVNQDLPWSTSPPDNVICFLQDDSQLINTHAFAASVVDFALSNQAHQSVHIIRRVSVENNIVQGSPPQTSPITQSKYWQLRNIHLGTTGLFNPKLFDKIGNYPIDLKEKTVDGFTSAEDVMSAKAVQSGLLNFMFCPHIPSFAAVWNDPRGMHAIVRGENRVGHYLPPFGTDGLYYEMVTPEQHAQLQESQRPVSFTDTCRGIGWDYARDQQGDLLKYDTKNNMSVLYSEGPVTLFDGTPSSEVHEEPQDSAPTTSKNLDYMDDWLSD
ncbi:hypothetical protein CMK19_01355 [Candidatus Poribacteria bacterium]|nr:hypothetical protein [Candidatus Poribacteria bacterium]